MKAKGLGTGLGALFGDATVEGISEDFEFLQIQRIEPRPDQPRTVFEQDKIDELTDSIREHGVLTPLTVRCYGDGFYQIIAGERRWRAARAAGLTEVPARIVVADDKKAMELAMVENLQREDLSPIEEARGYRSLMDDFGMTQEEISQKVSKSRPAVANSLRLLSLPNEVVDLVINGKLPAGSARALLAIKDDQTIQAAAKKAVENEMSVREVESLVKKALREKPENTETASTEVDYVREAQNKLSESLGRRVTIKHNGGKGKIEIEYYDQDDFDVIYDTLTLLQPNIQAVETKGKLDV